MWRLQAFGQLSGAILLLGFAPSASRATDGADAEKDAQAVLAAWDASQTAIKTGMIRWVEQKLVKEGSLTPPINPFPGKPHPDHDVLVRYEHQFIFAGASKWKHAVSGQTWDPRRYEWVESSELCVCDGAKAMQFTKGREGTSDSCKITSPNGCLCIHGVRIAPITMSLRILARRLFDDPNLRVELGRQEAMGAVECDALLYRSRSGAGRIMRNWISTGDARRLMRHSVDSGGKETLAIEFQYSDNTVGLERHVPSRWTITETPLSGGPRITRTGTVTELKLNQEIQEGIFSIKPPTGTIVFDSLTDPIREPLAVVKPDGTLRPFPVEDFGATDEQLFSSEPGEAFKVRKQPIKLYAMIGGFLVLGGLLCGWWAARRRGKAKEAAGGI